MIINLTIDTNNKTIEGENEYTDDYIVVDYSKCDLEKLTIAEIVNDFIVDDQLVNIGKRTGRDCESINKHNRAP